MKTLPQLAREALEVQDACNLSGVARSFVRVIDDIKATYPTSSEWRIHPIIKLWVDKLASLTNTQGDWNSMEAYTHVNAIAVLGEQTAERAVMAATARATFPDLR